MGYWPGPGGGRFYSPGEFAMVEHVPIDFRLEAHGVPLPRLHSSRHYREQLLLVERRVPSGWQVVADDGDYRITHIGFDDAGDAFSGVSEAETGKSGVVDLPIRLQHYPRP
jgi:hypothetical protein